MKALMTLQLREVDYQYMEAVAELKYWVEQVMVVKLASEDFLVSQHDQKVPEA